MSEPKYTLPEIAALQTVSICEWAEPYVRGRGPSTFARGDWWPNELLRRANEHERRAKACRVVAEAMRREIARVESEASA